MNASAAQAPITVFDIVKAVIHYRSRVVFISLLLFAIAIAIILLLPRKYESEAQMYVRLGKSSAAMDPATVGPMISIQESRETEMNSIIDMLKSRGLADSVVAAIGEDRILKKYAWGEIKMEEASDWFSGLVDQVISATETHAESVGIAPRTEIAVNELMSNLRVSSPKKSTTLSVVYRARNPELAYDVVRTLIDEYQKMHLKSTASKGAVEFFESEFNKQKDLLTGLEEELRAVKDQASILTLEGKKAQLQQEQDSISQLLLETRAEHSAVLSKISELESNMRELPETYVSERTFGIEQGASDAMRDRLYELELREEELASRLSEDHPDLKKVRRQLEEARRIMGEQPTDREHEVVAKNSVLIEMQKELLISKSNAASLEEKLNEIDRLEHALQTRIAESNQLELRAESLQREIAIARENYQNYAKKLEESRINAEQDKLVALSNISVVTPPVIRQKPVSPRRSLLAMAALVFSVLTGVVTALFGDFTSRGREVRHVGVNRREATSAARRQRVRRRSAKVAEKEELEKVNGMKEAERPAIPR